MRNLVRNSILVILITLVAITAIIPPSKKLRKGKDLAGGVNVVYQVDVRADENAREVLDKVKEVVKSRLDPQGVLEISIVTQGNDRIEISMPLPSAEVKELRAKFEEELAKLTSGAVEPDQLEQAMRLPPAERTAKLEAMSGGDASRLPLLKAAADAYDAMLAAKPAYE